MRSTSFGPLLVLAVSLGGGGATCGAGDVVDLPKPIEQKAEELGPGDVIEVRIYNEPDLSGTHQISERGTIRMPLIGVVNASDVTPDELTQRITKAYNAEYLKDAEVSLFVKERNSRRVYVLGQVGKPGPYRYEGRMTVIDAIALAGGTTKLADADRCLLTRNDKHGKQVRVLIQVRSIGQGHSPDVELQPGDILFVPETPF